MPTGMKFNPKDNASVIKFLESLDTVDSVLENSAVIMSTDFATPKAILENIIRHEDLTIDQLSNEKYKLTTAMRLAVDKNIPVSESTQEYMVNLSNMIDHKIDTVNDIPYQVNEDLLLIYENELFDCEEPIYFPVRTIHKDILNEHNLVIEKMDASNMISATGIRECFLMICDPVYGQDYNTHDMTRSSLECFMRNKIHNTLNYEMGEDRYHDLPIMEAVSFVHKSVRNRYWDKPEVQKSVDDLYNRVYLEMIDCAENAGFNPNPFGDIYDMAPFDVGSRKLVRTMADLIAAETDEEIEECLLNFGRMCQICEAVGPEILTEKQGFVKKKLRSMARGSQKLAAKIRGKFEGGKDIKVALKKIKDPMAKFIDGTIEKIHKADQNERRNIIIKGGVWPKVLRWVKRGMALVIAGSLGEIGALMAGITLLTMIATDTNADLKAKNNILKELENELEIVNEKIEDSRNAEDKDSKYKLMRIRAKLQKDIDRISLGLKY